MIEQLDLSPTNHAKEYHFSTKYFFGFNLQEVAAAMVSTPAASFAHNQEKSKAKRTISCPSMKTK